MKKFEDISLLFAFSFGFIMNVLYLIKLTSKSVYQLTNLMVIIACVIIYGTIYWYYSRKPRIPSSNTPNAFGTPEKKAYLTPERFACILWFSTYIIGTF